MVLANDPMTQRRKDITFCDNCHFGELPFQKEGEEELLSVDDMREFINQRKPTTLKN